MADEKQPTKEDEIEFGEETMPKTGKPEVIVSSSFTSCYANSVKLFASPWDIRLVFGEVGPGKDGRTLIDEQRVGITMSYEHAKAMMLMIVRNIKRREEQFGLINVKPIGKNPKDNS